MKSNKTNEKQLWKGVIISVQPRIRLTRSFDQRHHGYLGYVLSLCGEIAGDNREFTVGIGKAAQAKHAFRIGDVVSGQAIPVSDARTETAEYYKVSALKLLQRTESSDVSAPPPWQGVAPELEEYRKRGHRRLDARTYTAKCLSCIWDAVCQWI